MAYYTKLPIVLLSEIASSKEDSYRCRIASYLMGRMGESISAEEIARDCFVSKSAVSRFCREIGLEDFIELKELLASSSKTFEIVSDAPKAEERAVTYIHQIQKAMAQVADTLDYAALKQLVKDILKAERVMCFGLLKAETAAINLQSDLSMLGLRAFTKVSFKDQMDYLSNSTAEDLVIIFSYQGVFFEYDLPPEVRQGKAKVWVVTGNPYVKEKLLQLPTVQNVLCFQSDLDFFSHPYQLLAASSILAQETARALEKI